MEIDSKPEELDRLERRHHPAQDRAARRSRRRSDEASKKRLADSRRDSSKSSRREYADLEEIWKAEKAAVQGAAHNQGRARARARSISRRRAARAISPRMAELQYGKIPELEKRLAGCAGRGVAGRRQLVRNKVTEEEIAEVVSKWTGIPVSKMLEGEREKLLQHGRGARAARRRPGRGA